VSGGGRGIGKSISALLSTEGASVVVNDKGAEVDGGGISKHAADQTVTEIRSNGGEAVANYDDVSTMEGGENLIKMTLDTYKHVDILINSAGSLRDRMIYQMRPDDFYSVIKNNAKSAFTTTKFASILFRQQRSGRIINMVSDAGLGDIGRSNYAAATEGIIGMTRTIALDLGKYGITANAVSAMADTRLFPGLVEEQRIAMVPGPTRDERAGIGPTPQIMKWDGETSPDHPDNVAPLVVYLSTDASPHVNGNVFGIRGGSIYLYSNPTTEKTINKWGNFTMNDMDVLFPKMIGKGF
jgi:NAD(P)-dependent dehydrogenase (short-subunit alcohol dehydrogenase family)